MKARQNPRMMVVALEDLEDSAFYGCPTYLVPEGPSLEEWRRRAEAVMKRPFPDEDEDWIYDVLPDALKQIGWIRIGSSSP